MKRALFFCVILVFLRSNSLLAQKYLTVISFDGEEHNMELSSSSSIVFNADSIAIYPQQENVANILFSISDVRKLFFSDEVNNTRLIENLCFSLYPNPTSDSFVVNGIGQDDYMLTVYSMNGNKILQMPYRRGSHVDVSSLAAGIYLVRIDNCVYKFVKE